MGEENIKHADIYNHLSVPRKALQNLLHPH